jgi:hypothetical protein
MQVVYRAKTRPDAESARDVLVGAGIAAHIADQAVADMIRVQVDNRWLDHGRRAIATWLSNKSVRTR